MKFLHYDINKLSFQKRKELIEWAKILSYKWSAHAIHDESYEHKSYDIDLPFDVIMGKLNKDCECFMIHRFNRLVLDSTDRSEYIEIGFTVKGNFQQSFLSIYINPNQLANIIDKFKLKAAPAISQKKSKKSSV